jgi:hypothetical protein
MGLNKPDFLPVVVDMNSLKRGGLVINKIACEDPREIKVPPKNILMGMEQDYPPTSWNKDKEHEEGAEEY